MSRELDAKVAEKVFGPVKWVRWSNHGEESFDPFKPWDITGEIVDCEPGDEGAFLIYTETGKDVKHYSTDIAAAFKVVDKLYEKGLVFRLEIYGTFCKAVFFYPFFGSPAHNETMVYAEADAENPAEVICIAALRAVSK